MGWRKDFISCILVGILLTSCMQNMQGAATSTSKQQADEIVTFSPKPVETLGMAYPLDLIPTATFLSYPAPTPENPNSGPTDTLRPSWTPTATPTSGVTPNITLTPPALLGQFHLPAPLYYLYPPDWASSDTQVWRLEPDGQTRKQISHEAKRVRALDVARDGKLAYISDNDLIVTDKNGGDRKVLIAGGTYPEMKTEADLPNHLQKVIENPTWSPDGQSLAVGWNGVKVIHLRTGKQIQVSPENQYKNGITSYRPLAWSLSGNRLVIWIGYYQDGELGIVQPEINATIISPRKPVAGPFGGNFTFLSDGRLLFGNHVYYLPPDTNSLWIVNSQSVRDGLAEVDQMKIKTDNPNDKYIFTAPKEVADGRIYFIHSFNAQEKPFAQMAWINPAQMTGNFEIHRIGSFGIDPNKLDSLLWSSDGSWGVVPFYKGNLVVIRTSDGAAFQLDVPSGANLRWGTK